MQGKQGIAVKFRELQGNPGNRRDMHRNMRKSREIQEHAVKYHVCYLFQKPLETIWEFRIVLGRVWTLASAYVL
jgi:hypothetical protein